jgi:hypothetical protein
MNIIFISTSHFKTFPIMRKLIPATLSFALLLSHQLPAQELKHFKDKKDRYGYKNAEGKVVIEPRYQYAADFTEGLGGVQQNDKWGFIDAAGKQVIPAQYDNVLLFSDGLAAVNTGATRGEFDWSFGGKWGFIDKTGNVVIPITYDQAGSFAEGLAPVNTGATRGKYGMTGGKYGYIDKAGKEVIPFVFESAASFSEGLASVSQGGKEGFIDKTGKVVIPLMYDRTSTFRDGLAFVKLNGKCGFINRSGEPVIPISYEDADYNFHFGLAYVKQNGLYGFIDRAGKMVIPCQFQDAHSFREGLASVKAGDKWGFIDTNGKMVIDTKYDYAGYFIDGMADVKIDGKQTQISLDDKSIFEKKQVAAKPDKDMAAPKLSETEEDALVGTLMNFHNANHSALFQKVNELNNALKPTMITNDRGEINRLQWTAQSINLQQTYLKDARKQAGEYEVQFKRMPAETASLDLHMALGAYLKAVNDYIRSCEAWADFIYDKGGEDTEVLAMLERLENNTKAMNLGYVFLGQLTQEYSRSKTATGKYLTTMKQAQKK